MYGLTSCIDKNNGPIDYAMVMVPLHAFGSQIDYNINKDLTSSLFVTYKGRTRDYGSSNV